MRCWFQLCHSWVRRLQYVRSPSVAGSPAENVSHGIHQTDTLGRDDGGGGGGGSDIANGGGAELPARLQRLAAAMEEGALLVERLYDANHLSLEDFDADADAESESKMEPEVWTATAAAAASTSGAGGDGDGACDLPGLLLVPSVAAARRQLDELAAAAAAMHPGLFPAAAAAVVAADWDGGGGGGGNASSESGDTTTGGLELLRAQLEAISKVLFHDHKFRHEPIEWVYDGLAPALLPQVLQRRRGIPLSLAVLYCSVARRLGVAAAPVKVAGGGGPGVAEGPASLHQLPPEVAARQAGRTVALAPPLDSWLVVAVAAPPPSSTAAAAAAAAPPPRPAGLRSAAAVAAPTADGEAEAGQNPADAAAKAAEAEGQSALFVDVDRRGRVMGAEEARRRFADLAAAPLPHLLPSGPPELWAELGRVMVTAHGRRGESDLVAHWLVQVLALDHRAPEWRVMSP